jgi:hypothetical protein
MSCWTYLAFVESIITFEEVGLNTITETELKELFQTSIKVAISHKKRLSEFMREKACRCPVLRRSNRNPTRTQSQPEPG